MTTVNGTSGAGPIWPQNNGTPVHAKKSEQAKQIQTPIDIACNDTVKRADLDNISPYAALGVNIPKQTFTSRVEKEAQEMFPGFKGYYTLNNPEEAGNVLADLNSAISISTEKGTKQFLEKFLNGDIKETTKNIEESLKGFVV